MEPKAVWGVAEATPRGYRRCSALKVKILGKLLAILGLSVLTVAFLVSLVASVVTLVLGLVLYFKRKGQSPRIPRWIYLMFGVSFVIAGATWIWWIYPGVQRGRQVKCCADMKTISMYLEDYKAEHGDFPLKISDALPSNFNIIKDGWGNLYHYEQRPGSFILVSYGSDGKSDGLDYWALHEHNGSKDISGKFKADHVLSDLGWHRVGGK